MSLTTAVNLSEHTNCDVDQLFFFLLKFNYVIISTTLYDTPEFNKNHTFLWQMFKISDAKRVSLRRVVYAPSGIAVTPPPQRNDIRR